MLLSGSPKNRIKIAPAIFVLVLFAQSLLSQRIINVNLFPTNTSVVVKFTISAGPTCNGFSILHSLDSITFNEIASEPGICGLTNADEDKSFTHQNPVFNKINHYKIRLDPFVETSAPKSIFVSDIEKDGISVYPSPFIKGSELNLRISGENSERYQGFIYDDSGAKVRSLDLTTNSNHATVTVSGLDNGVYVAWLSNGASAFKARFIIFR